MAVERTRVYVSDSASFSKCRKSTYTEEYFRVEEVALKRVYRTDVAWVDGNDFLGRRLRFTVARDNVTLLGGYHELGGHGGLVLERRDALDLDAILVAIEVHHHLFYRFAELARALPIHVASTIHEKRFGTVY